MKVYKLNKVSLLGTPHPDYGQAYWCGAEGSDLPLKFSTSKQGVAVGVTIVAQEAEVKKSVKGTEYLQLKTVSIEDSPNK
mgnify:FL=1